MKAPLAANTGPVGSEIIPIENRIFTLRGQQVLLDRDLAALYGVETKVLSQAVKRNIERFPPDFRFQLAKEEFQELVTNCDRFASLKHSATLPFAFNEQGVSMLSSVLKSETAIRMSILIMDAFVELCDSSFPSTHNCIKEWRRWRKSNNERTYTFGASFKDLGKKLFCFSEIESDEVIRVIAQLSTAEL